MSTTPTPRSLFEAGYRDLISVLPPAARLSPHSRISPANCGKAPGRKAADGFWTGFGNWRQHQTTLEDVQRWEADGANVGLRAARFPGLDIDSLDPAVADTVELLALDTLGPAPVRIGRPPKRLLAYRTDTPFPRMRLRIKRDGTDTHLVELLGDGQQYLVTGVHPTTMQPYVWLREPPPGDQLTAITAENVEALFARVGEVFAAQGYHVQQEGTGRRSEHGVQVNQGDLRAPSLAALREAMAVLPNADELFPDRGDYIKMGYALRAAAGENLNVGFELFGAWCARWDGGVNDPETVRAEWEGMKPPYDVGYPWIASIARQFGFNDAVWEFEAIAALPTDESSLPPAVEYSEQDLADTFLAEHGDRVRSVPLQKSWLVWDGARWKRDEKRVTPALARDTLRRIADRVARQGATAKEKRAALRLARAISSAQKVTNVLALAGADPRVTVIPEMLDAGRWVLNTPSGIVDLKTGELLPHDADLLLTKITGVPLAPGGDCPRWKAFLREATGGDQAMSQYLQRLLGYCLTGSVREHVIAFIHGPGGNGKTVLVETAAFVLGDYATHAPMNTFMASAFDRHPTEVAALQGARFVTASETDERGRWNEARLKSLSGGDRVTARFMRQDFFEFDPQFKLVLIGNHKPELTSVGDAIRRRLHLIPFTTRPPKPDPDLLEKLRAEAPAILGWMVEGCFAWQREGLAAPKAVQAATEEYLSDEDALGRWLTEECEVDLEAAQPTLELFVSWCTWCRERGEDPGTSRRFAQLLINRGFKRWRDPKTRRHGFAGVRARGASCGVPEMLTSREVQAIQATPTPSMLAPGNAA